MPMFDTPGAAMRAGASPGLNPGMAPPGPPLERDTPQPGMQQPQAPPPVMAGQQPGPDQGLQAMANQVYQLSQQLMLLQKQFMDLKQGNSVTEFHVQHDDEGRIKTIMAVQGAS